MVLGPHCGSVMGPSLIAFVSWLWLLLGCATVGHSKFTATEKMDIMKINMENIRKNIGVLATTNKYINNKLTNNCPHQRIDEVPEETDKILRGFKFDPVNNKATWMALGSALQAVKISFLNMHNRQKNDSCGSLDTILIKTTTTTATTTITTTQYPDLPNTTQMIPSTISVSGCQFPFIYSDISYYTCTEAGSEGLPWCSTKTDDNGNHITGKWKYCDGPNAIIECSPEEFRCGDGTCIPKYWRCDGQEDCQGCEDEKNCTEDVSAARTCPSHMFQCRTGGTCIQRIWLCDGQQDCPHGEDEENCSGGGAGLTTPPPTIYEPGDIPCEAGGLPVPIYYRCDGTTDCDNCMDEDQCVECPANFSAVGHQCLLIGEVKRTWEESSLHCQRLGGRLAEPRDMDSLKCFLKKKGGLRARYWVGGSNTDGGQWMWSGGATVPNRLLPSGGRHQRMISKLHHQQTGQDKQCLEIMPRRTNSPFNISNCHTKFRSLCQINYIS